MNNSTSIRVLLADDHEVVRSGYRRLIESTDDIDVVDEADSGEDAYQKYFQTNPDVLVIDLSMPGIGGLEASRRILLKDSNAHILIFSVHENEVFLNRAFEHGVLGYITKRSASNVMLDAIRQVAKGEIFVGQEMIAGIFKSKISSDETLIAGLTPREFEVFRMMTEGLSVNEIATTLNLSPKTIGHHCSHVKNKLKISDIASLTRLAIRLKIITA